jgi:hypothetical protein
VRVVGQVIQGRVGEARVVEESRPFLHRRYRGVPSRRDGLLPKPKFVTLNVVKGLPSRCKCEILRCAQNDIFVVK